MTPDGGYLHDPDQLSMYRPYRKSGLRLVFIFLCFFLIGVALGMLVKGV